MDTDYSGYALGIFFGLAFLAVLFVLSVLYLATLSRAINKVSASRRPFPGGLAWLAFVPYFGEGWLAIAQVMAARSIRADFAAAGRADHRGGGFGLAVAWATFFVVRTLLVFAGMVLGEAHVSFAAGSLFVLALIASFPQLIVWIVFWGRLRLLSAQMPLESGASGSIPTPAAGFPVAAEARPAPVAIAVAASVPCASALEATSASAPPSTQPPL